MTHEKTYRTFEDIYTGIFEHARQPLTDTNLLNKVKRLINGRYLQVQAYRKWRWRKDERNLKVRAKYTGTDCDVTNSSRTLIINDAITEETANDWIGYKFYVSGQKEIYVITALQSYVAAPTIQATFILNCEFNGSTDTGLSYFVFQDEYGMWPDFEEFDDVVSFYNRKEVRRVGPAKLMQYFNENPFREGKARMLSITGLKRYEGQKLGEFVMGQDFMGRAISKKARIYPSITNVDYILPITMIRKTQMLQESTDKPMMSEEDRIILYLGGLADLYGILSDQTGVETYEAKFSAKLEQMANDDQEDADELQLAVGVDYRSSTGAGASTYYDFADTSDDIITEI